jgi:hypothetical protein
MSRFEDEVAFELAGLLRASVPPRAVRLTVRELVVTRFERGPLGAREVSETVEATLRAACRLVRELGAPEELVETVCRATLEGVRGHGGETAQWIEEAQQAAEAVLREVAGDRAGEPAWPWLMWRVPPW